MKLVPRPLFQSKPPAKLPGDLYGSSNPYSMSPHRMGSASGTSNGGSRRSSGSSCPCNFSLSKTSSHQRRSTSGSIPISPPTIASPTPARPPQQQTSSSPFRRWSDDARQSAYYPFVASRKGKSKNPQAKPSRMRTPTNITTDRSPASQRPTRSSSPDYFQYPRRGSGSNAKSKQPLFQRFAESAAKYADLLTSPAELPERRNHEHITPATVASSSPHLRATQVQLSPAQNHLGWSPRAKIAFDEARTTVHPPRRLFDYPQPAGTPAYTHISTPARPSDETKIGLREPESPTKRKGSIFGGMLDGWKDSQAEKRREKLKQAIKVVPNGMGVAPGLKRRSTTRYM